MKQRRLSTRSLRVLRVLQAMGPLPTARHPQLVAIAGDGPALYDALLHLRGRFLIRWDAGGLNVRVTKAGFDLLRDPQYRNRPT